MAMAQPSSYQEKMLIAMIDRQSANLGAVEDLIDVALPRSGQAEYDNRGGRPRLAGQERGRFGDVDGQATDKPQCFGSCAAGAM